MSLLSRLLGWVWKLPPAETSAVLAQKNIQVTMSDGVTLMTDHYAPLIADRRPTLLRSVYTGRTRAGWTGELCAERGFHWYDFFLPQTIRVHYVLAQAGHRSYLTIGPWMHTSAQEVVGCLKVHIDLWPTASRFLRGHCIRLQVSSGSFPLGARNLGSGEPYSTGTTLREASRRVYHNPAHPSAVILPIVDERQADQEPEGRSRV